MFFSHPLHPITRGKRGLIFGMQTLFLMMVASALSKPSAFSRGASKNELMKSAPPPSNFEGSVLGCINQMFELFVRSRRVVNERTTQISPNCSNLNFQ